jgi:hypothetical protein
MGELVVPKIDNTEVTTQDADIFIEEMRLSIRDRIKIATWILPQNTWHSDFETLLENIIFMYSISSSNNNKYFYLVKHTTPENIHDVVETMDDFLDRIGHIGIFEKISDSDNIVIYRSKIINTENGTKNVPIIAITIDARPFSELYSKETLDLALNINLNINNTIVCFVDFMCPHMGDIISEMSNQFDITECNPWILTTPFHTILTTTDNKILGIISDSVGSVPFFGVCLKTLIESPLSNIYNKDFVISLVPKEMVSKFDGEEYVFLLMELWDSLINQLTLQELALRLHACPSIITRKINTNVFSNRFSHTITRELYPYVRRLLQTYISKYYDSEKVVKNELIKDIAENQIEINNTDYTFDEKRGGLIQYKNFNITEEMFRTNLLEIIQLWNNENEKRE